MKKLSILALALSILAASCTKEVGEMGSGRGKAGEIRVSASVNDVTKAIHDGAVTTFVDGDQLSLYVWTGENTAVPAQPWINGEVNTYSSETKKWDPANLMLWQNGTAPHYFLGVYPARAITNFTADPFEQTASYEASDLLVGTILGDGVVATTDPIPLVMDHLMAKLKVTLTLRNQWSGDPEVHVYVKAAYTGTVDYLSKTITPGNDVTTFGFDGLGEGFQTTLIIPQEGVTEITVTVDGTKYVYTHPTSIPLTRGHVTTLPLIVGKDVIELDDAGITVEGWTAGELPEGLGENTIAFKFTDLASIKADYIATNNTTLTGTLDVEHYPVKISIADGATVTLDGVTINGVNNANYKWAGITCLGDATIILKEGSVNSVMGFYQTAPGIFIPENKKLIIKGEGSLTASNYTTDPGNKDSYGYGAGIGGGQDVSCGNIEIQGGNITAYGGKDSAGIGGGGRYKVGSNCGTITISGGTVVASSIYMGAGIGTGYGATCGIITISEGTVTATGGYGSTGIGSALGAANCSGISISGGTVTATGGYGSAGIGSGQESICGTITIASTVTKVTAVKGDIATNSVGAGNNGTCGTVTVGGMVTGNIPTSPYMYPIDLSKVTANVVAGNGARIFETLAGDYKISIDDGATVILDNASISYSGNGADWAGLTLIGDGTIQLADGTTNNAIGGLDSQGYSNWPGIFVPEGKTLTINGNTGVLNAARGGDDVDHGSPAGIGAAWKYNCGNIVINGGVINATGGAKSAGIGGAFTRTCGDITINGGTITAIGHAWGSGIGLGAPVAKSATSISGCNITITGGTVTATGGVGGSEEEPGGAGIGTGYARNTESGQNTITLGNICISGGTVKATGGVGAAAIGTGGTYGNGINNSGNITITDGVTKVTATKGSGATNSIGKGGGNGTCGTVTIGGVEGAISESPYVYPLPYPIDLSEVTSAYVGSVIASNGKVYATASKATDAGTTAVAVIAYVGEAGSVDFYSETYKGLAIAMSDANNGEMCQWCDTDQDLHCVSMEDVLSNALGYKDGIVCTSDMIKDEHDHPAATVAMSNNGTAAPTGTSNWFLPSIGQWNLIVQGLATKKAGTPVTEDLARNTDNPAYKPSNFNSIITAAGGTELKGGDYWASTLCDDGEAWMARLNQGRAYETFATFDSYVRSVLAF